MSGKKYKVIIPENPEEQIKLAEGIYAKHLADGKDSPLLLLKTETWETNGPLIEACRKLHEAAEKLKKQMLEAYRDRDNILVHLDASTLSSRDVLLGINHENPKALGGWTFEVQDAHHRSSSNQTDTTNA